MLARYNPGDQHAGRRSSWSVCVVVSRGHRCELCWRDIILETSMQDEDPAGRFVLLLVEGIGASFAGEI